MRHFLVKQGKKGKVEKGLGAADFRCGGEEKCHGGWGLV